MVSQLPDPPPKELQEEAVLNYDQARYPFNILGAVIGEPPGSDLSKLHKTDLGRKTIFGFQQQQLQKQTVALGPRSNPWNRRFHACKDRDPKTYKVFMDMYHDFVRTFVLDHLGTALAVFQVLPTFRCHLPGCGSFGIPHRDEDYGHPRCEINFWLPISCVFGSNSLYAESQRGAGDFHPFELQPGQVMRFYGNQVWHYAVPNETDTTRISIDFRVIREEECSPATFSCSCCCYSVMNSLGLLQKGSPELLEFERKFSVQPPQVKLKKKKREREEEIQTQHWGSSQTKIELDDHKPKEEENG